MSVSENLYNAEFFFVLVFTFALTRMGMKSDIAQATQADLCFALLMSVTIGICIYSIHYVSFISIFAFKGMFRLELLVLGLLMSVHLNLAGSPG